VTTEKRRPKAIVGDCVRASTSRGHRIGCSFNLQGYSALIGAITAQRRRGRYRITYVYDAQAAMAKHRHAVDEMAQGRIDAIAPGPSRGQVPAVSSTSRGQAGHGMRKQRLREGLGAHPRSGVGFRACGFVGRKLKIPRLRSEHLTRQTTPLQNPLRYRRWRRRSASLRRAPPLLAGDAKPSSHLKQGQYGVLRALLLGG